MATLWGSDRQARPRYLIVRPPVRIRTIFLWYLVVLSAWFWIASWLVDGA